MTVPNSFAAAAAAQSAQQAAQQQNQAQNNSGNGSIQNGQDSLTGARQQTQGDSLMGGGKLPSIFNKTHGIGDKVTGIIVEEPREKHSRDINGNLRYWDANNKPTTTDTGRPIYDTVFVLQTDYRLTPEELAAKGMTEDENDGLRGLFAGTELSAMRAAIAKAGLRGKPRSVLVGKRVTIWRSGQTAVGKGNPRWDYVAEITEA